MHIQSTMRASMIAVIAMMLFVPLTVAAKEPAKEPSIDPRCWPQSQKSQCEKAKGYFDPQDISAGGSKNCGQGWFQCYSGSEPIKIAIKIGEVGKVKNLGEYIRLIYVWLIPVGAILAVVVIMIGGLVWLTSGGADRLGKAKELIGNAIIGLLLLLLSYLILNTINPDLVRLSLPRTQILRPVSTSERACGVYGAGVQVHSGSADGPVVTPDQQECGLKFYLTGASERMCLGAACPSGQVCITGGGMTKCETGSESTLGERASEADWKRTR